VADYVIRGGHEGYARLQVLARTWWPTTSELLRQAGLGPGMCCLDVGCGSGEVSLELARLVGPGGHVTAIDMDEIKLGLAREAAAGRAIVNVEFRVADVSDWRETTTYDLVYCRFLLQHLRRPLDLLAELWASVSPGGALVVEDADFEAAFCEPPNDGHEFWKRTYCTVLERRGGDPLLGRKLYRYFSDAGIPNPHLDVVQLAHTSGEPKTLPLLTLEATADAVVAEDVASEEEVIAAVATLTSFTADPSTVVGSPRIFQVWATRPAGQG
jgi:ubiquinone/menaquinone biosynthesis C-methylase UbiE